MKKPFFLLLLIALLTGSFAGGVLYSRHDAGGQNSAPAERRVLYYVDPMNPAHTSDKPGKAPCGMDMEPVYADEAGSPESSRASVPGTVKITPAKQQMLGIRMGTVEAVSSKRSFRTLGRVAPDENRIYSIVIPVDGWARTVRESTTGSVVQQDQLMATYFTAEFYNKQKQFQYALRLAERDRSQLPAPPPPYRATSSMEGMPSEGMMPELTWRDPVQLARTDLLLLGVGKTQLEAMAQTRDYFVNIEVRSPVTGIVLSRNITPDQQFEKGTEFFRVAEMSRVWVWADVYESDAQAIRPGMAAKVSLPNQGRVFDGVVSDIPPPYDAATRTYRVRLELDNPGLVLRPDMLVDVDFTLQFPPGIVIPTDAVLDSGAKKIVFIDRGEGFFEPRQVEVGRRVNEGIEVLQGLAEGERIVVSGNFLIDSESRMKLAAAGFYSDIATDPVCKMQVDRESAAAAGLKSEHAGKAYYFCTNACKSEFERRHGQYLGDKVKEGHRLAEEAAMEPLGAAHTPSHAVPAHAQQVSGKLERDRSPKDIVKDPVCNMHVREDIAKAKWYKSEYRGKTYYFCSRECKAAFDREAERYVSGKKASR